MLNMIRPHGPILKLLWHPKMHRWLVNINTKPLCRSLLKCLKKHENDDLNINDDDDNDDVSSVAHSPIQFRNLNLLHYNFIFVI